MTLIEERQAFQSDQWVQLPVAQFRLDERHGKSIGRTVRADGISLMILNRMKILKHS